MREDKYPANPRSVADMEANSQRKRIPQPANDKSKATPLGKFICRGCNLSRPIALMKGITRYETTCWDARKKTKQLTKGEV